MAKRTQPYQGTEAWLQERRSGYGASDAPILVEGDEPAWRGLHGEKLGLLPPREATETMELGHRFEDVIARIAAERSGTKFQRVNRLIRHPDLPFVFASLDRRRALGKRQWRPVEIKKWAFKGDEWGAAGSDIIPVRILYQVQQQAAVTGSDAVDLWVLFGGSRLEQFVVGRDESMIDEILALEDAAWKYVARGEMPPWPGPAPKRITLAADEIELDDTLRGLVELHEAATATADEAAQHLKDAKDRLRAALADVGAAKGFLPDGRRVSVVHRPQEPRVTTDWKLVASAYRKLLEALPGDVRDTLPGDPETFESLFTTTSDGQRPLRISIGKDAARNAA